MSSDLSTVIEGVLEHKHQSSMRSYSIGKYHASHASIDFYNQVRGSCLRKLWYTYRGLHGKHTAIEGITRMAQGTAWEKYLRSILGSETLIEASDRPDLYEFTELVEYDGQKFYITGHPDLVINLKASKPVLVEVKSIGTYIDERAIFPERYLKNPAVRPNPQYGHILQTFVYAHMLRDKISRAELLYQSRISGSLRSFSVWSSNDNELFVDSRPAQINFNLILARYATLHRYLETKQLPPRDFAPNLSAYEIRRFYEHHLLSKKKYNDYVQGRTAIISDRACEFCSYLPACLRHTITD